MIFFKKTHKKALGPDEGFLGVYMGHWGYPCSWFFFMFFFQDCTMVITGKPPFGAFGRIFLDLLPSIEESQI